MVEKIRHLEKGRVDGVSFDHRQNNFAKTSRYETATIFCQNTDNPRPSVLTFTTDFYIIDLFFYYSFTPIPSSGFL